MKTIKIDILSCAEGKVFVNETGFIDPLEVEFAAGLLLVHAALKKDSTGKQETLVSLKERYTSLIMTALKEISVKRDEKVFPKADRETFEKNFSVLDKAKGAEK